MTKTTKQERDLHDLRVLGSIERGCGTAGEICDDLALGNREVDRALQRLKKAGSIELTGKPRRWTSRLRCEDCDQPTLPPGVEKKPNEYDHASGCPREARS